MTTIITKNSSTASSVPVAGDLTKGELAVNVTDKKLYTKDNGGSVVKLVGSLGNQEANAVAVTGGTIDGTSIGGTTASTASFTTVSASGNVTLSGGTANGVLYLNGSKVATSGSALTFDGTMLTANKLKATDAQGLTLQNDAAYIQFKNTAGSDFSYIQTAANNLNIWNQASGALIFATSNTEAMRLTSTGLGIGTSSPYSGTRLTLQESASSPGGLAIRNRNSTQTWQLSVDAAAVDDKILAFIDPGAGAVRMALDSSGNLGLGVTPSAWSGYTALQVSNGFSVWSSGVSNSRMNANTYYNGGYKYVGTGTATMYEQDGYHAWYIAASGTAGNAITFTQALTLGSDGNLLVGTTSGSWTGNDARIYSVVSSGWAESLYTTGSAGGASIIRIDNTGAKFIDFRYTSTNVGSITTNGTTTAYNTSSDYRLKNITGPITNSGVYIDSLNPVEGTWKADGSVFVGLIAHEVQEASRTQVAAGVKDGEQMQGMDYSSPEIIANLIAEVKSLRQRVATLEAQ